ncbi:MAG: hypothetical protein ACRDHN_00875 [Thermomicrobiales bacterium]
MTATQAISIPKPNHAANRVAARWGYLLRSLNRFTIPPSEPDPMYYGARRLPRDPF